MKRNAAIASAAIALLLCAAAYQVSAAQADDSITTTLHPGWNLIGWIHEATAASDLFEQLDELERIHDGDEREVRRAAANDPAALLTLQPGRGYWFHINADQPVIWTRPAEPATRRFHLEPGEQLVAWTGPSGRPIADVLLGLRDQLVTAWRWVAADQRFIPWSPDPHLPTLSMPTIDRGDAVRINLTEGKEWLHPTGDLPQLRFAGGLHHELPDNFRDVIEADLRFVVEQFVAKFRFEVPAERLHIRIPTTWEAVQRQRVNFYAESDAFAFSPVTLGGTSVIVIPWDYWLELGDAIGCEVVSLGCWVLSHEYFHILQYELGGPAREQIPGWLLEGTAMWSEHIVFDEPEPDIDIVLAGTNELDLAARFSRYDYAHSVGLAATAMLVERAGPQAIVEFWRDLPDVGESVGSWKHGFGVTFGVQYAAFLEEFAERQKRLYGTISGRFQASDGRSLPPIYLRAVGMWRTSAGDSREEYYQTNVESDGTFNLALLRLGPGTSEVIRYVLIVTLRDSTCEARLNADGTLSWLPEPVGRDGFVVLPDSRSPQPLHVQIPNPYCRDRIAIQLAGAYGIGGVFSVQYCLVDTENCVHARGLSANRFAEFVPFSGDYWIRVTDHDAGCSAYISDDGLVQDPREAARFASAERVGAVSVRLDSASDSCSRHPRRR